ncbi:MAG: ABC transporter ATP-binding protein [Oscillospiraceae bacterium]
MIELTDLKKSYGGRRVLDIEKIRFEGEICAVLGANGSGKSTLLKLIAHVINPDSGQCKIEIGSEKIGYMPQIPYGFSFSVQKNVELAMSGSKNKYETALEILKKLDLYDRRNERGNTLSGGETQRLALARLLVQKNSVLLLDEPTSSCDISGIDIIEKAIREYSLQNCPTIILCTHSPAQALRLADRAVFLQNGKIIEQGETKNLIENPETDAAREFLRHWRI